MRVRVLCGSVLAGTVLAGCSGGGEAPGGGGSSSSSGSASSSGDGGGQQDICSLGFCGAGGGEVMSEKCGDGVDNDNNGEIDDGCACEVGDTQSCYNGSPYAVATSNCLPGSQTCINAGSSEIVAIKWGPCEGGTECIADTREVSCGDGKDNDDDNLVDCDDADCAEGGLPCATGLDGECGKGTTACVNGVSICQTDRSDPEVCDGVDNDCNGKVDDGIETQPCGTDEGQCLRGIQKCQGGEWTDCLGGVQPTTETCNNKDDDCDGVIDNGNPGGGAACTTGGSGACSEGTVQCINGQVGCVSNTAGFHEDCANGLDDDCDGASDCNDHNSCDLTTPGGGVYCTNDIPRCTIQGSGSECEGNDVCTPFSDFSLRCYENPGTDCTGHYWYDGVDTGTGCGGHGDVGITCYNSGPEGATCTATPSGSDLRVECGPTIYNGVGTRIPAAGNVTDFMALDHGLLNPYDFDACLLAWGVHPLKELKTGSKAVALIPGKGSQTSPLTAGGLTTYLPVGALPHYLTENFDDPNAAIFPKVPHPNTKQERGARIAWAEEPSAADARYKTMPYGYTQYEPGGCATSITYEQLINHMYPGPEIFNQLDGVTYADSTFVVPINLSYYGGSSSNLVVLSELVCQMKNGSVRHAVSMNPVPSKYVTPPKAF